MKLFPVLINGYRHHMINFEKSCNIEETFIVASDGGGELLKFHKNKVNIYNNPSNTDDGRNRENAGEGALLQTERGNENVFIQEFLFDEDTCALTVKLGKNKPAQDPVVPESIKELGIEYNEFLVSFSARQEDMLKLEVVLQLDCGVERNYSHSFLMFLVPQSKIYNAVIDCGSESSQMGAFQRTGLEKMGLNNRLPLLDYVLTHYGVDEKDFDKYIQSEGNDEFLYKSVFYAKKSFCTEDVAIANIFPVEGEKENSESVLRMTALMEKLEELKGTHLQLHNMKISGHGGVCAPNIRFNGRKSSINQHESFFQRKYITQFVYQAFKDFCNLCKIEDRPKPKVVVLNMLVPNIYSYKKSAGLTATIYKDAMQMIANNEEFRQNISGVQVNAVSESDASLVGAISLREDNKFPDGKYLVLDAGKGTLDFSLTEYKEGRFTNIMKSGFVGASAAISYGFMLDLLKEFLESKNIVENAAEDDFRQFIYENILGLTGEGKKLGGGDLFQITRLVNAVDDYKINYKGKEPYVRESAVANIGDNGIGNIKLETFRNWIDERKAKVKTSYTDAIIHTIVNSIYKKLLPYRSENPDFVVFAGRGFLFAPLKERMLEMLKSDALFPELQEKSFLERFDAADNKNICLFVTDAINQGRYDGFRLHGPLCLDAKIREELEKMDYNKVDKSDDNGVFDRLKRIGNSIGKTYDQENDAVNSSTCDNDTEESEPHLYGHKVMVGCDMNHIIGGVAYSSGKAFQRSKGRMFYSDGDIIVRDENNKVHYLEEKTNLDAGLAFASLFPHCTINRGADIYLPLLEAGTYEENAAAEEEEGCVKVMEPVSAKEDAGLVKSVAEEVATNLEEMENLQRK